MSHFHFGLGSDIKSIFTHILLILVTFFFCFSVISTKICTNYVNFYSILFPYMWILQKKITMASNNNNIIIIKTPPKNRQIVCLIIIEMLIILLIIHTLTHLWFLILFHYIILFLYILKQLAINCSPSRNFHFSFYLIISSKWNSLYVFALVINNINAFWI